MPTCNFISTHKRNLLIAHINSDPLGFSTASISRATHTSWSSWAYRFTNKQNLITAILEDQQPWLNLLSQLDPVNDKTWYLNSLWLMHYQLMPVGLSPAAWAILEPLNPNTFSAHANTLERIRLFDANSPNITQSPRPISSRTYHKICNILITYQPRSIRRTCELAQISRGCFYHYFNSLEQARQASLVHRL